MNKKINNSLQNFHIPTWNELPNIDLYLDQVVNLVNSTLSPFLAFSEKEKDIQILTKTMINNYVKNNLIEAPIKKKYSKIQVSKLFVICILKQVYSMNDIKSLIDIALNDSDLEKAYNKFGEKFEEAIKCTYNRTDFTLDENSKETLYLLKSVLLSCSYKIYVQNIIYKTQQ